jgi:DNA-binding transcriptional LysR family regulator
MISWDDYRLVLAIARAGGLPGAAQSLRVTLSTVFRRLERIEEALGARLFDRLRGSYQPTEAGHELVRAAERMEQDALSADRAITGRDQQLTGTLRLTATEALAACFLARHIPAFHREHPGITVEIISDNRLLSLAGREADIALRPKRPTEETLVARKAGTINWGIYASKASCAPLGEVIDLSALSGRAFIDWDGGPASPWLEAAVVQAKVPIRTGSLLTNAAIAASDEFLAVLPCILGELWPGLGTVLAPLPDLSGELWVITHEDMRGNARLRVLFDYLIAAAMADRALFEGLEFPQSR